VFASLVTDNMYWDHWLQAASGPDQRHLGCNAGCVSKPPHNFSLFWTIFLSNCFWFPVLYIMYKQPCI